MFASGCHLPSSLFQLRSNIPCHLTDISCGLRCNQMLKCGMHKCKRICHKGECLIDEECKQPCVIPRLYCNHPCMAPCHPSSPCPTTSCSAKVGCPEKIHCPSHPSLDRKGPNFKQTAVLCICNRLIFTVNVEEERRVWFAQKHLIRIKGLYYDNYFTSFAGLTQFE